jgi:putative isomerase
MMSSTDTRLGTNDLATGWNTWNVRSVLSHVLLPDAFAVSLGFRTYDHGRCLREALIGRKGTREEKVRPGEHAYDGSYTSLVLEWQTLKVRVDTATDGDDWFARVTLLSTHVARPSLVISAAVLWNRDGHCRRDGDSLILANETRKLTIQATGRTRNGEPVTEIPGPYLLVPLDQTVFITTSPDRIAQAGEIIDRRKAQFVRERSSLSEAHHAMQTCLAWDTIYDPENDRVISPVSRIWSCDRGGWVLFDWDTYFAAWMAGIENKRLAYANAIAITRSVTPRGFIPNFAQGGGFRTIDRSQPPVGAITVQALCDLTGENILAEQLFDTLLQWNRWWPNHRDQDGYLCWGSNPYEPEVDRGPSTSPINTRFASALESGLDNSPMYQNMPYDAEKSLMQLADVGLMSLYIADCLALADLAGRIGRKQVIDELNERTRRYTENLKTLWCEEIGLFLNKRLDTGELQTRLSPTHFYPLLAKVATQAQAERMMNEHFFNPAEFWGEWILPSIARNDPAYPEQDYWKGPIWAPMNFLVYLGICSYDLPDARQALVEKSEALLLKEWREHGHVHENYDANSGMGCGKPNSDAFYHWGGLLGLIGVLERQSSGNRNSP